MPRLLMRHAIEFLLKRVALSWGRGFHSSEVQSRVSKAPAHAGSAMVRFSRPGRWNKRHPAKLRFCVETLLLTESDFCNDYVLLRGTYGGLDTASRRSAPN